MVRGTTPTFTLTVTGDEELDLTLATSVYVTLDQHGTKVNMTGDDLEVEAKVVRCYLSQTDSLALSVGEARMQLNWTYEGPGGVTRRNATKVKTICIEEQLLRQVI